MDRLKVREATLQDHPKLGELNFLLIQDEGHENKMDSPALSRRMTNWLQHEYRCFVATVDDGILGYALFKTNPTGYYLRQLFTASQYRRQGIASQLLDFLFAEIWLDKEVRLDVLATNQDAIAFYEQYGLSLYCHTYRRVPTR